MKGATTLLLVGGVAVAVGGVVYLFTRPQSTVPNQRPATSSVGTGAKNGAGDLQGQLIGGLFGLAHDYLSQPHSSGNSGSGASQQTTSDLTDIPVSLGYDYHS